MGFWKEAFAVVKENDPAARYNVEIFLTSPGIKALAAHKLSHFFWCNHFKLIGRMHAQLWRFFTQIEIHPGAKFDRSRLAVEDFFRMRQDRGAVLLGDEGEHGFSHDLIGRVRLDHGEPGG